MKKLILVLGIITLGLLLININYRNKNLAERKEVIQNIQKEESNFIGVNSLAIMLQGDDGNYTLSSVDSWPGEGFVFNETLSRCENGGKLSWNDGKIILKTSASDKCYVYFDKYEPLKVLSAEVEAMDYNSVRLNSVSLNKEVQVSQYIVTIIDPNNFKGIFTFTNLNQTVTHNSSLPDYSDGCIDFMGSTYNYEIYVITSDEVTSEKYNGIVKLPQFHTWGACKGYMG